MKAIRVHEHGEPTVLKLEEVSDLQLLGHQVLIQVRATGVNPVETYIRAGTQGYSANLPYTPGTDAAGLILAVGKDVTEFKSGDRVYCAGSVSGTYAEQALCEASHVHLLPESITYAQGAAIGIPYTTAYRALMHRGGARPGEIVLIHGASGAVGLACVQIALAHGLTVVATAGSERSQQLLREQGAHHVVDHHDAAHYHAVMHATQDRGVDLIIEMLANKNLGEDLPLLTKDGRVVIVGSRGPVEIVPRDTMARDATILGMTIKNASAEDIASIHAALGAGLTNGTLNPVVGEEIPLAEAPVAHERIMQGQAYGKIVLIP